MILLRILSLSTRNYNTEYNIDTEITNGSNYRRIYQYKYTEYNIDCDKILYRKCTLIQKKMKNKV